LPPPPPKKNGHPWVGFNTYKTKTEGRVKIWYESLKEKRLLASPWLRQGDNIKKDITEKKMQEFELDLSSLG